MMPTHKQSTATRFGLMAIAGLLAVFIGGCQSTGHDQAGWSHTANTPPFNAPLAGGQPLAAADGLGMIVFGNPSAVAEPKLPKNWFLADAANPQ